MAGVIRLGAEREADERWFQSKFRGQSDAWRAGFKGWDAVGLLNEPCPYEKGTPEYADWLLGAQEAAFWYAEREADRKESRF